MTPGRSWCLLTGRRTIPGLSLQMFCGEQLPEIAIVLMLKIAFVQKPCTSVAPEKLGVDGGIRNFCGAVESPYESIYHKRADRHERPPFCTPSFNFVWAEQEKIHLGLFNLHSIKNSALRSSLAISSKGAHPPYNQPVAPLPVINCWEIATQMHNGVHAIRFLIETSNSDLILCSMRGLIMAWQVKKCRM